MMCFPSDAPRERLLQALAQLGFEVVREGNHIALARDNSDGSRTPMTLPNHRTVTGSALGAILTQAGVTRDESLGAYGRV
jgi:predicted RNA binding protein YcfA (HicA-like mRNA interferase family)